MIEVGSPAPSFSLPDQDRNDVSLADFSGERLIVCFYPGDFTSVCGDQLALYQSVLGEIEEAGAKLIGISVDSADCHRAFSESLGLKFPLLSDFHPKGAVCESFGAYIPERGHANRSLILVEPDGIVSWTYESPPLEVPGANLIFDALSD